MERSNHVTSLCLLSTVLYCGLMMLILVSCPPSIITSWRSCSIHQHAIRKKALSEWMEYPNLMTRSPFLYWLKYVQTMKIRAHEQQRLVSIVCSLVMSILAGFYMNYIGFCLSSLEMASKVIYDLENLATSSSVWKN